MHKIIPYLTLIAVLILDLALSFTQLEVMNILDLALALVLLPICLIFLVSGLNSFVAPLTQKSMILSSLLISVLSILTLGIFQLVFINPQIMDTIMANSASLLSDSDVSIQLSMNNSFGTLLTSTLIFVAVSYIGHLSGQPLKKMLSFK